MPMFPDSGVPAVDARNSIDVNTLNNCPELWYSTSRCQPRFDPAAANAMLAEDMNLIMKGELQYDCARLDHIERAVRYITQRGLTTGTALAAGPFDYTCVLDPPLTRYNDFLTLIIIPNVNNQAAVRINVDNRGLVPLLRNDGMQLESADLKTGRPCLISYWAGNWFHVGLCPSQVPILVKGGIDIWIRTDGNDNTGDGTANTPDKAFQTISGAWQKVGSRYAATPLFSMNMKLGNPGTYAGASIGPFGGNVTLSGLNPASDRTLYRISSINHGNNIWAPLAVNGVSGFKCSGLTLLRDAAPPSIAFSIWIANGTGGTTEWCDFYNAASNPAGAFIYVGSGASFNGLTNDLNFEGNNLGIGSLVSTELGGLFLAGGNVSSPPLYNFRNCPCSVATLMCVDMGIQRWQICNIVSLNVTGPEYLVASNSIVNMAGKTCPGNTPGTLASGGQFIP